MPIHPSVDGLLSCLYLLAIANNAAVNTGIQKSFRASVFSSFRYIPRSGIAGSYGNSVFKLVVLAALGLCCSAQAVPCCAQLFLAHSCSLHTAVPCCAQLSLAAHRLSLVVVCGVYSLVVVGGCLTVVASLVAEHRL